MVFIGMDVGGTTARLRMCDAKGNTLFEGEGKGGTLAGIGRCPLTERFRELFERAFRATGTTAADVARLALGASGVDTPQIRDEYETMLMELGFQKNRLLIVNDGELLLKMFEGPGIVLISGTGSIALGTKGDGTVYRCGGWEHLLSDKGSGTDLGMQLLRGYVEAKDGMVDAPLLIQETERVLGFSQAQDAVDYAAEHIMEKADIGSLAQVLETARALGDEHACHIMTACTQSLAFLVTSLLRKMEMTEATVSVLFWGSVLLRNRFMQESVSAQLASDRICIVIPDFTALDAAVTLALGDRRLGI